MKKPVIALVGRPNVGKSTLFNRLVEQRLAIIDDVPGTTRDRLVAEGDWAGHSFFVIDTGGIDPSKQRDQAPLSIGSAPFVDEIRAQVEVAIEEADVVVLVVDALSGATQADQEVASLLRRRQRQVDGKLLPPVILAVNKADSEASRLNAMDFYSLGMGEPFPISAIHGTGTGDLLDEVVAHFPAPTEDENEESAIKVAIVGKPNAGKSSLLNKLLGRERAIVSDIPGTTRDAIDTPVTLDDQDYVLIDTAGIRKRGSIIPGVEKYSVLRAMQAIERCDVAVLVVDATTGITAQDTHIAGYINEAWKSVILVVNKWDLIEKDNNTSVEFERQIRQQLNFLPYIPILFLSAKSGQRVQQLLPLVSKVRQERLQKVPTSQLNRILINAQDTHQQTSGTGKPLRIYYGTQVKNDPPTFLLYCNDPTLGHFTYKRFLENQIRKEVPFIGTPIQIVLKKRERKSQDE